MIQNKYMDFIPMNQERKTEIVQVANKKSGFVLGHIRWFGAWRQYCFMPSPNSVFNTGCLNAINAQINELMFEHRQTLKHRKEAQCQDNYRT